MATTEAAVIAILGDNYGLSNNLTGHMVTAASLAAVVAEKDTDGVMSSTTLERIEAYLAAHFYAHADQLYTSKSTDGASGSFQGQFGMVLMSTQYGQTACLLDETGYLAQKSKDAEMGARKKTDLIWLGKDRSQGA